MSINKVPWSESINLAAKKRIKEIGGELERKLHDAGIMTADDLRRKRTKVARIVASVFSAEVNYLESFAIEHESKDVPNLSDFLEEPVKMED